MRLLKNIFRIFRNLFKRKKKSLKEEFLHKCKREGISVHTYKPKYSGKKKFNKAPSIKKTVR